MNEMNRNERIGSQGLPCLESLSRRSLIKGMAGLSATLASSSLSPAIAAQTQDHHPATPGPQVSQSRVGGDLLLHRTAQVDISNFFTRRPQPKGSCNLVSYTLCGSLTMSRP